MTTVGGPLRNIHRRRMALNKNSSFKCKTPVSLVSSNHFPSFTSEDVQMFLVRIGRQNDEGL